VVTEGAAKGGHPALLCTGSAQALLRPAMHRFMRTAGKRVAAAATGAGCAAALYSAGSSQPARADSSSGVWAWSSGVSNTPTLAVSLKHVPECDPEFVPAVMWNRAYRKLAAETVGSAPLAIGMSRPGAASAPRRSAYLPVVRSQPPPHRH
jgi:hypothetical protein